MAVDVAQRAEAFFAERVVEVERRADGSLIFRNPIAQPAAWPSIVHAIRHWATKTPDAPMIGEWREGGFETVSYSEIWKRSAVKVAELKGRVGPDKPLMILAPNSIDHAVLALGAMRAGVPVVPVSLAYAAPTADPARLRALIEVAGPGLLCVTPTMVGDVLSRAAADLVPIDRHILHSIAYGNEREVDAPLPGPGDIAKLLFTSGSTGTPKAVINTHRMLCANQAALSAVWPGVAHRPPLLLDWLPWSHTFGGNFTFHFAVTRGGTYLIDAGKPMPGQLAPTLAGLAQVSPTAYFNVPAGYEALVPQLEADLRLAERFLGRLDFLFSAAAAMPQSLRNRIDGLARRVTGRSVPIIGGWGATETAPCATAIWFQTESALDIGAPLPGVSIKLAPEQGKLELRVKGPNVMPGYWRAAEASAAAFDAEGYLRMGDAARLVDSADPARGLVFDGRLAENFKLRSGTWVHVGTVRQAVVEACAPLVQNVAVTGHDQAELGLLVFVHPAACSALAGETLDPRAAAAHPKIVAAVRAALAAYNAAWPASSTRIRHFLIQPTPPAPSSEITDKGYLNQRGVLAARADEVARLDRGEGIAV